MKTDFQLIQEQNTKELIKKYAPLIKSYSSKYNSRLKDPALDWEDLVQENYEYFLKALQYVKKEKIDERFKLGSIAIDFLTGYNNCEYKKEINKFNRENKETIEEKEDVLITSFESVEEKFFKNEIEELFEEFIESQKDEINKKILIGLYAKMEIKQIANLLGVAPGTVIYRREKMKKPFIEFMKSKGYFKTTSEIENEILIREIFRKKRAKNN